MIIDYNKNLGQISILKDWTIATFDINLNFINKISLKFDFRFISKITYFKYNNHENHFEIICADSTRVYSYQFNLNGDIIFQLILSESKKQILLKLDHDNLVYPVFCDENFSYEASCRIYKNNQEIMYINLHNELEKCEKDWDYEYVEGIVSTNKNNQFSLISVHANYGVQGIKIFELNSNDIKLIYDLDNLVFKGAFHHLSFNETGEKFIVLLYERNKDYEDYFCICEYSINNNREPIKIYKTEYGYWNFGEIFTHYFNESIVCIIRNSDIILFNLVEGKTREILKRDLNSDYFISFNILIYHLEGKIIVFES